MSNTGTVAIVSKFGRVIGSRPAQPGDWAVTYGPDGETVPFHSEVAAREVASQHNEIFACFGAGATVCQI